MMPYLCFAIALCIVAVTLFLCVRRLGGRGPDEERLPTTNLLIAGVFLAAVMLFLPIYHLQFESDWSHWLKTILISFHNAIRLFVLDGEFDIINDYTATLAPAFAAVFSALAALLYIIAPVLTFSFVISLFKDLDSYRGLLFHHFSDLYVFSELNERALILAESLLKETPRAMAVFHGVSEEDTELRARARKMGACCFEKDITENRYRAHGKKAAISFFVLGGSEEANVEQALKLRQDFSTRDNTRLYLFSSTVESGLVFSGGVAGKLKVRRVDPVHALIDRTLYEQGVALFRQALPAAAGGKKQINAVILGLGAFGGEMLRSLAWFCQMDGYSLRIDAFDRRPDAASLLRAQCPELLDAAHNGVQVPGEAEYEIALHTGVDVMGEAFAETLAALPASTFGFVALGRDDANIEAAVRLRTLCERRGCAPQILAVLFDPFKRQALEGLTDFKGNAYAIQYIGDRETCYDQRTILHAELEEEALRRHLGWGSEEDFWRFEFNYRSSVAAQIHHRARILCGVPGADQPADSLPAETRESLECLEHRRWNAYMRSIGYVYSGSRDKASRNDLAKMHHDLVPFGMLSEEEKRKDSQVGLAGAPQG